MGKIESKTSMTLNYYLFQNKIMGYLSQENKEDEFVMRTGYFINPNWIKNWKELINYTEGDPSIEYILKMHKYESNINDEVVKLVIEQYITPKLQNKNFETIKFKKLKNSFKFENKFITLETLENFVNDNTFYTIQKIREENLKYVFKQNMIIFFFPSTKIIKIIYYHNEKNKIINFKFTFDKLEEYYDMQNCLKKSKSKPIKELFEKTKIFTTKKYTEPKNKYKLFLFEDEKENDEQLKNEENSRRIKSYDIDSNKYALTDIDEEEKKEEDENFEIKKSYSISHEQLETIIKEGKLLSIIFLTQDHRAKSIVCKSTYIVKEVENKLVQEFPEFNNCRIFYTFNGKKIDENSTFLKNGIKDGDKILISKDEFEDDQEIEIK